MGKTMIIILNEIKVQIDNKISKVLGGRVSLTEASCKVIGREAEA